MQNCNNIKMLLHLNLKIIFGAIKDYRNKEKLRYHNKVVKHNLEDQKCLSILTSTKKKNNIAKIRRNSYTQCSKIRH